MSYVLTGNSNPHFPLRALILAPAVQSRFVLKIDSEGKVEKLLRFIGTAQVEAGDIATHNKETTTRYQVARFEILEDSQEAFFEPGETFDIEITELTLENELFAFIPRIIKQDLQEA
jgi:hypothetical protein